MKRQKKFSSLVVGALMAGLLLAASAAQAVVVRDPGNSSRATGITNLDIDGTPYNVSFLGPNEAFNVYGELPGNFPFNDFDSAATAVDAAAAQLNAAGGIFNVGPEGGTDTPLNKNFNLVFETEGNGPAALGFVARSFAEGDDWSIGGEQDQTLYNADARIYASFSPVPVPAAVWLFGSALGLLGWLRRKAG